MVDRDFRRDLMVWVGSNPRIAIKVLNLVEEVMRDPYSGLGKPELLKYNLEAYWSRRITGEHRLVYRVTELAVHFVEAAGHYTR